MKDKAYISFWLKPVSSDAAMVLLTEGEQAVPIRDWSGVIEGLDFPFKAVIDEWKNEFRITQVIANELSGGDEGHPLGLLISDPKIAIVPPISVMEGLAACRNGLDSGSFAWGNYNGRAQLEERMNRGDIEPTTLMMALLQGIAHKPKQRGRWVLNV